MTSGKSVALVQSRAAPSTVTRATDFPAVINVGYCPRVRAITNTYQRFNRMLDKKHMRKHCVPGYLLKQT